MSSLEVCAHDSSYGLSAAVFSGSRILAERGARQPRRLLPKITRTGQVYLAVDQATRDVCHARAGTEG